jgi:hypothetical protein
MLVVSYLAYGKKYNSKKTYKSSKNVDNWVKGPHTSPTHNREISFYVIEKYNLTPMCHWKLVHPFYVISYNFSSLICYCY